MSELSYLDILKYTFKVISFEFQQRRLTSSETKIVKTIYGQIKGVKRHSVYNDQYFAFEGVPFAKPPLGELRFKAPQPLEPWTDIKDCTNVRAKCIQPNLVLRKIQGSEDCLYLNIYSKNLQPEKPQPVMVWIHGGAYQVGEATRRLYSPDYFMKEDVVLVCLQYRLGALGFLSFKDEDLQIPGNAGLKDQVMGIKWVKENCAAFGGDPNNITVFGESAGGASTHFLMITEQTKGLFHKAITMSGSAFCDWALTPTKEDKRYAYRLAVAAGYQGKEEDKDIFKFISQLSPDDLITFTGKVLTKEEKRARQIIAFEPIVEPYESEGCIFSKDPKDLLANCWGNSIPQLIGGCSNEGLLFYFETKRRPKILDEIEDCQYLTPYDLPFTVESEENKKIASAIQKLHFGDKKPGQDTLFEYLDLLTIKQFWHGLYRTALNRQKHAQAKTYVLRFDFDSPDFNYIRVLLCGKKMRGTCHGDDLSYLFYNTFARKLSENSDEYKALRRMVRTWVSFAETGNPSNEELGVEFESITKDSIKALNLSDKVEFGELKDQTKIDAWNEFYDQESLIH